MLPIDFSLIDSFEQIYENETAPKLIHCFSKLQNTPSTTGEIVAASELLKISFNKNQPGDNKYRDPETTVRWKMNSWNKFAEKNQLGSLHDEDTVRFYLFLFLLNILKIS